MEKLARALSVIHQGMQRSNPGAEVLSIRRTRKEEILLVLKKGGDVSAFEKALDQAVGQRAVRAARRKVDAVYDHWMPRRWHGRTGDSMYWWNDQLSVLRRECLAARRRLTRSKGDPLLHEEWKKAKSALRQGIKKSRLQCWKDLIGEVEKDPWGLAFKIVIKRLVTRRKTPGLGNPDRVKYIVRSFFPHIEPFQR